MEDYKADLNLPETAFNEKALEKPAVDHSDEGNNPASSAKMKDLPLLSITNVIFLRHLLMRKLLRSQQFMILKRISL